MPERKDSIDSFDEFFGESKRDDDRKKSPIKPKENETSIAAIVKTQPIFKHTRTPEERRLSSPKIKRKYFAKIFIIQIFFFYFNKRK